MADNRMYLVHLPTGLAVRLGKRIGQGWYLKDPVSVGTQLETFYAVVAREENREQQDDFALALEEDAGASIRIGPWTYSATQREDGLVQLDLKKGAGNGE